mmetsp:Transcript_18728/g.52043  ORF Transcript_18728/g.52043 Transcript_18728/m.52043 type:complete len:564 (-) Transcript_18728:908-2599(-)
MMVPRAEYGRYGVLRARAAPLHLAFINGDWARDLGRPHLNGRPHYIKLPNESDRTNWPAGLHGLHICYHQGLWRLASIDDRTVFGLAHNDAQHPNTVDRDDWLLISASTGRLEPHLDFSLNTEGPNTERQPFLLEELGNDFFSRVHLKSRKVVWFVDPVTGLTFHSAAKACGGEGGRTVPGKRWCHICEKCISANNFQSQHLTQLHRPSRPVGLTCMYDQTGMVLLEWMAPTTDGGLTMTGYRLHISFDNGVSWTNSLDLDLETTCGNNPHSNPSARIALHQIADVVPLGVQPTYRFAVAGLNRAGSGPVSDCSPPIVGEIPNRSTLGVSSELLGYHAPNHEARGSLSQASSSIAASLPPQETRPDIITAHAETISQPDSKLVEATDTPAIPRRSSMTERLSAGLAAFLPERLSERLSAAMGMDISSRFSSSRMPSNEDGCGNSPADDATDVASVDGDAGRSSGGCGSAIEGDSNALNEDGGESSVRAYMTTTQGDLNFLGRPVAESDDMHFDLRELMAFATERTSWRKMAPFCAPVGSSTRDNRKDDSSDDSAPEPRAAPAA